MSSNFYEGYGSLKGWDKQEFMNTPDGDRLFYEHYLGDLPIRDHSVLEVGFGNGGFLGWAKDKGARVFGTELLESALNKAISYGVEVLPVDIISSVDRLRNKLCVFAAIDVMEHLTADQHYKLLSCASEMLVAGGRLLLRFPNGQSPLSLPMQYGDSTHVSIVSIPNIERMIEEMPLKVVYAGAPIRTLTGSTARRAMLYVKYAIRGISDKMIQLLYGKIPLYENAVMLIERV
jgi:2-polyprenyl-3-methyl-5-hydroxy-6-metoxy-1,4-benzoquinol methylase